MIRKQMNDRSNCIPYVKVQKEMEKSIEEKEAG